MAGSWPEMEGGRGKVQQVSEPAWGGKEGGTESKATSRFSTWVRSLTEGAELAEGRRPDSGGPGPTALGLSTRGRPQSFFAFIVTSKGKDVDFYRVPEPTALELMFHGLQSLFNVLIPF